MIHQVYPQIYLNEIPLPKNPLKVLNSYIIFSPDRTLIIDTGFNLEICKEAFMEGIEKLQIDLKKTDLILTHMHVDHTGLADYLRDLGCEVYIGKKDGKFLNNYRSSSDIILKELTKALDLDNEFLSRVNEEFGEKAEGPFEYTPLTEGDCLEVGPYKFEVIDIPGHSPGHIGLYEPNHKLFFGGDHILNEITPNITFWHFKIDSLGNFVNSLRKIGRLEIDLVFPSHRSIIKNHQQRIEELIAHHDERLLEITEILRDGPKSVSGTAAKMHWDLKYKKWSDFPAAQKWFASGEAMAHLEHLVHKGVAQRIRKDNNLYYELII